MSGARIPGPVKCSCGSRRSGCAAPTSTSSPGTATTIATSVGTRSRSPGSRRSSGMRSRAWSRRRARYAIQPRKDSGQQVGHVLICGAGPAGLLWVQYLRNVLGFDGKLLVTEPSAAKRALAERFGAETVDPTAVNLVEAVLAHTCGRRVELLVEASGSGALFAGLAPLVRKQATVLLY